MAETNTLRKLVDDSDIVFRDCHALLRAPRIDEKPEELFTFQARLARAIYFLEHGILGLKKEARELVGKKAELSLGEINRGFRSIDEHVQALERAIDYGKILGDAFAWLFYRHEEKLLRKHFARERIEHLPVGTGGIGEIEFVRNTQRIGDCLVLYHGITTFLRIGDISFSNLTTGRIDGLAELKTKKDGADKVQISVHYVGSRSAMPKVIATRKTTQQQFRKEVGDSLYAKIQRQTGEMVNTFTEKPATLPELAFTPAKMIFDPRPLNSLFDSATLEKASSVLFSPGLVLVGVKLPVATLAQRVLNDQPIDAAAILAGIVSDSQKLHVPGSADNGIMMDFLIFPRKWRYGLSFGMQPVFWWPIRPEVVDALVSGSFMVLTLFNPAYIFSKLRERGFLVVKEKDHGYVLEASHGTDGKLSFPGLNYYLSLARQELMTEDSIIEVLTQLVEDLRKKKFSKDSRINLQFGFGVHDRV